MMLARDFAPGFRINLHIKDLANALDTGHGVNAPRYHRVDFRNASYVVIPARCSSHPFSRRHAAIDISAGQSPFNSMSPSLPGGALTRHHQGSMLWVDPRRSS
ncbi:MAG: NAD-binding protein [Pauljensenia sp.]